MEPEVPLLSSWESASTPNPEPYESNVRSHALFWYSPAIYT
jgi:hypothetical protein